MGLFNRFGDVTVRNEVRQEKSDLEKVIDIEEEIIKKYERNERFKPYQPRHDKSYQILRVATQEKIKDITITPKILQEYIDARENKEDDPIAVIRGMYSSALLELICIKNQNTNTIIDGKNKTFNYLFYHIHNVKNLTLQNIQGNCILADAGCNKGTIAYLTLSNIKGNGLLSYLANHDGNAKNIILTNIIGDHTLFFAGANYGKITYLTLSNIIGTATLSCAGNRRGIIKNITLQDITGDNTLQNAVRFEGNAKNIILSNVKGERILDGAAYYNGNIKQVAFNYIINETSAISPHLGGTMKSIFKENKIKTWQKEKISEINTIASLIHTLPLSEQKAAHERIAQLQKEIFRNRFQNRLFTIFEKTKKIFQRKNKKGET